MINWRPAQPQIVVVPFIHTNAPSPTHADKVVPDLPVIRDEEAMYRTQSGGAGVWITNLRNYYAQFSATAVSSRIASWVMRGTLPAPLMDAELEPRARQAIEALRGSLNPERAQAILDDPWFQRACTPPANRTTSDDDVDESGAPEESDVFAYEVLSRLRPMLIEYVEKTP